MKKGIAIMSVALSCAIALCASACGGGNSSGGEDGDTFPYWEKQTQRVTDAQYYTESGVQFPSALWQTPQSERYEALDHDDIHGYFIDSVQGTKVFCYVGIPATASATNKVPAVVLVHGATGTAYYDWVRLWMNMGYAAIAMDTEGRMPIEDAKMETPYPYVTSIKDHGPLNTAFGDSSKPAEEQWVYHAVSAVIASRSFLQSFEAIDGERIGITGISYGGFITCLAAGYDDRYAWAAPVYGCLANLQGTGEIGVAMGTQGAQIWDGTGTLQAANMPVLFVNSNVDQHFSIESTMASASACKQSAIAILPDLLHSHSHGSNIKEIFTFADDICRGGTPLIRITKIDQNFGSVKFAVQKNNAIKRARVFYTYEEKLNKNTVWEYTAATCVKDTVYSNVSDAAHFFISLQDKFGNTVTSKLF